MKRFFLSTITLCFFVLTVPISAQANFFPKQYETPRVFPDDSGQYLIYGNYTDCWTVNDTVYLFNEMFDAVYTWRPGQSAPALLQLDCFKELRGNHPREEFSETLRLFIFNDSLCVLDTLNSTFYRYDNNASWETLCRLDDPSSILTDIRQFRIHSLVFEKNNIFFLAPLGDWLDESLLSIDISTGELKELKAPVLQAICKYKDGYLLVNDNGRVKTYELATQMLSEDVLCVADEAPSNIFYDEPSDQIYYAYQGFLYRKSGMMQPEQIRTLSTAGTDITGWWQEEYYEKGYSGLYKLAMLPYDKLAMFPNNGLEYDRL